MFEKKNFLLLTLVGRLLILHLCLCSSFFPFLFFDISPLPFWSNEGIELLT